MGTVARHTGERNPVEQLRALHARGFRFIDPGRGRVGVGVAVCVRAHDNVVDVVRLSGVNDAVAARVPGDADILAPATVLWRQEGAAGEVLNQLLALPDDRVPAVPRPRGFCCR